MRSLVLWIGSTLVFSAAFWTCFGACVDTPVGASPPNARIVASWDPLSCGDPHRVVVELADDAGDPLTASAPCTLGHLTLDAPHFGGYHGRTYAWVLGSAIRSVAPADLDVEQVIVQWPIETPK